MKLCDLLLCISLLCVVNAVLIAFCMVVDWPVIVKVLVGIAANSGVLAIMLLDE